MRYSFIFVLLAVRFTASAEPPLSEAQVAEETLAEIRELRKDLRQTAAIAQRAQILIYRMQVQRAIVDKASAELEQARDSCAASEMQMNSIRQQLEHPETARQTDTGNQSSDQAMAQLRLVLADLTQEVGQCQASQVDMESRFRTEQAKLRELEEQLDQIDQALAMVGTK
jgi:chromosome segregation ATPase